MAGLIWAVTARPDAAARIVHRALARMRVLPSLVVHSYEAAHVAIALLLPEGIAPTVFSTLDDGRFAALHGDAGCSQEQAMQALAHQGRQLDDAPGDPLPGLYHAVVWSPHSRTAWLSNDLFGALSSFETTLPEGLVGCSEPGVLQSLLPGSEADVKGIASLLSMGHQSGTRTDHRAVLTHAPALRRCWRVKGDAVQAFDATEWQLGPLPPMPCASYFSLVTQSLAERLRGRESAPTVLLLTGGEDSRVLVEALQRLGIAFTARTLDGLQAHDAEFAARVAAAARVEHAVVGMDAQSLSQHLPLMTGAFAATMDWHGAAYLPLLEGVPAGSNIVMGFLGGTLSGAMLARPHHSAQHSLYRYGRAASTLSRSAVLADETLPHPLRQLPGLAPALLSNLYGRQRRYTGYLNRLAWNFGRPICPFASPMLLRWAASRSARELDNRSARRREICRELPALSGIASANDLLALDAPLRRLLHSRLRGTALSRLVRRLHPGFPRPFQPERLWLPVQPALDALPPPARAFVQRWLSPDSVFGAYALLALAGVSTSRSLEVADSILSAEC